MLLRFFLTYLGKFLFACVFDIRCNFPNNMLLSYCVTKAIPLQKLQPTEGSFFERGATRVCDVTSFNVLKGYFM